MPRVEDLRPSSRTRQHQARDFSLSHPDNWAAMGDPNANTVTVAPKAGLVADGSGQTHVGYGFIAAYYYPQNNDRVNLRRDTAALLQQIQGGNPNMRQSGQQRNVRVAGQSAIVTPLQSPSPFQGLTEVDMLVTVARPEGLFYMVFIAPESEWSRSQASFDEVVRSLRFAN